MKPKLLIFLAWIFFIAARRTSDELWYFCTAYSLVLSICTFFYRKDRPAARRTKSKS